ncbi:hypothetical protein CTI12_AA015990 [Artemisia annua]|uniref:Uncharacterized protein n=1 Tax=Artemisia annua TaxID=35608 RepID=A0A2U1Q434_ARTAN|nr:hypothetical protein CTI12_AA015990 [Artemisia annua]
MTSVGTESIILAVKSSCDYMKEKKNITSRNGVYANVVEKVREAFEAQEVLRLDCAHVGISYNTGSDNSVECAENVINTNYIGTKNMVKATIPLMRTLLKMIKNSKPSSLVIHFFSVAIFGVGRLLLPYPTLKRTWLGARLILVGIGPDYIIGTCFSQASLANEASV